MNLFRNRVSCDITKDSPTIQIPKGFINLFRNRASCDIKKTIQIPKGFINLFRNRVSCDIKKRQYKYQKAL